MENEDKIFYCFKDVKGVVLEIGAGGGLVTNFLAKKRDVEYLVAVDIDEPSDLPVCKYYQLNLDDFDERVFNRMFDYVVCRDVLMYLKDLDYTLGKLAKISKNMVLLNWYEPLHRNCHNKTPPEEIAKVLRKYHKNVTISYPAWYKWGYLIESGNEQ